MELTCRIFFEYEIYFPQIKKNQQKLRFTLESKHIEFELIDVAASDDAKEEMRRLSGNPTALPPQIFNGTTYCGVSVHLAWFSALLLGGWRPMQECGYLT